MIVYNIYHEGFLAGKMPHFPLKFALSEDLKNNACSSLNGTIYSPQSSDLCGNLEA